MNYFFVALVLVATLAAVQCGGYGDEGLGLGGGLDGGIGGYGGELGGGGGIGYGKGPNAAVGPNILYGGYLLSSQSISGPLSKKGILKTSFLPKKIY